MKHLIDGEFEKNISNASSSARTIVVTLGNWSSLSQFNQSVSHPDSYPEKYKDSYLMSFLFDIFNYDNIYQHKSYRLQILTIWDPFLSWWLILAGINFK